MNKWIVSAGRRGIFFAILLLAAALFVPTGGWAEKPENPGQGSGSGHGRKPPNPGGGGQKGDLLGDLWEIVRNVQADETTQEGGNGEPIHFTWTWPEEYSESGDLIIPPDGYATDYTTENGTCVQPFSYTPLSPAPARNERGGDAQFKYTYFNSYGNAITVYLIPLDTECNIPDAFAGSWGTQVSEVDSGRLALARTTDYVIDSAYEEALSILNTACQENADGISDCQIGLDPAGRLTYTTGGVEKTIDSPRENLALYQRVMMDGCLSSTDNAALTTTAEDALTYGKLDYLLCNGSGPDDSDLQRAASFLAGAADKSGDIGIDEVVYLNSILGINTVETSPTDGSIIVTGYFDLNNFQYLRSDIYGATSAKLLQPGSLGENGYPISFVVADGNNGTSPVSIYPAVFGSMDWDGKNDYSDMPIINFVRAADDAVSTVNYIHNYELPAYPVPLEIEPAPGDGLQQQNQLQGPAFLQ